ncbi:MAG TPA: zf-HC2 domain-containing protein [Pyrinomonadaceae bacterium]|nr:zf-HC2 domain-containing protein [Pyrinomonadaceae bacterium]
MTRCLDEATLQGYFDGELSGETLETVTLHLASCSTCAAAAREMEEEINLLMTALAPEFEASVPTERLRQRIDAAVLDARIGAASTHEKTGFGAFIASLVGFGTQRMLGYASLVVVLAFAAIFGLVKYRMTTPQPQPSVAQTAPPVVNTKDNGAPAVPTPVETGIKPDGVIAQAPKGRLDAAYRPVKASFKSNTAASKANSAASGLNAGASSSPTPGPVKLLPGERAYLQTIARLDSTIKANKKQMRPSLQVEYERNLAVVDRFIAATRSAAKKNPNDTDTADFMFAAYQSKVDLLNTIADARLGGGRSH